MEVPGEKPLGARERANNKLNAHNGIDARIRTRATLVGGEFSHHCTIPLLPTLAFKWKSFPFSTRPHRKRITAAWRHF